jgi:aryl-alcohol dehydrogenase-like predicted oxidoreductase
MRTRKLGKTGLELSELTLGTWPLTGEGYGPVDGEDADRAILRARELGINAFDTADHYGASGSEPFESRLGRLVGKDPGAIIVTRGGHDLAATPSRKRFDRLFLHRSAARSADRLRRAPDVYLLARPTLETIKHGEACDALGELVKDGVIKHWGVSCSDARTAIAAVERGAAVVGLAYNLFAQDDLHESLAEIASANVGLLTHSPLSYGLLCGTWSTDRRFADGDHRRDRWTPADLTHRLRQVAALRPLVHDDIHTLRAAALRFVLANGKVSSCIVGARSAQQIEGNVRAIGDGPPYLPTEDLVKVGELTVGATV